MQPPPAAQWLVGFRVEQQAGARPGGLLARSARQGHESETVQCSVSKPAGEGRGVLSEALEAEANALRRTLAAGASFERPGRPDTEVEDWLS